MNFYNIQVGTPTRKGGFIAATQFVAQSNNSIYEVEGYYREKYKGLTVNASHVEVIETPVLAKEPGSVAKTKDLENRIKELESGIGTRFEFERHIDKFSEPTRLFFNEVVKAREIYETAVKRMGSIIEVEVKALFPNMLDSISSISIPGQKDVYRYKCIVYLNGRLY